MRDDGDARGKGPASGKLRLPPLNALRAFHAVARHKSLRQAADELYVTPQAVGQQIKLLEDSLQVTLFERKGRSIEPTAAYGAFADTIVALGSGEAATCPQSRSTPRRLGRDFIAAR